MKLTELILSIKEENLPREKLEDFYAALTNLYAQTALRMAELEKAEAMFLDQHLLVDNKDMSEATRKRKWRGTEKGQELIQRKGEVRVIEKLLSSVKHRIFNVL